MTELGRTAREVMAANKRRRPKPQPNAVFSQGSGLPLAWQRRVDPADVLLDVTKPGNPIPWGRPGINHKTGNVFTPAKTLQGEKDWALIMRATRRYTQVVDAPFGVMAWFRIGDSRSGDADNFLKLVLDAGNNLVWRDDKDLREAHVHILRGVANPGTRLLAWRIR